MYHHYSVKPFILMMLSAFLLSCTQYRERFFPNDEIMIAQKKKILPGKMLQGEKTSETLTNELKKDRTDGMTGPEIRKKDKDVSDTFAQIFHSEYSGDKGFSSVKKEFMEESAFLQNEITEKKRSKKKVKSVNLADKRFYKQYSRKLGIDLNGTENKKLLMEVDKWMGTPYLWGGCSENGIDCSCLVKNIYETVYGIDLSRTSLTMCNQDFTEVTPDNLKEGDIICFDMKENGISHVGLYLKENLFVHASLSGGVRISSLDRNYFKRRMVMGGRSILPPQTQEIQIARLSIGELLIVNP